MLCIFYERFRSVRFWVNDSLFVTKKTKKQRIIMLFCFLYKHLQYNQLFISRKLYILKLFAKVPLTKWLGFCKYLIKKLLYLLTLSFDVSPVSKSFHEHNTTNQFLVNKVFFFIYIVQMMVANGKK